MGEKNLIPYVEQQDAETALRLAQTFAVTYGIAGHPIMADGSKSTLSYHGFADATNDISKLAKLFNSQWAYEKGKGKAWVALYPGSINAIVLDIDVKDGKNGFEVIEDLEARYGRLPRTTTVKTMSGGAHLWFKSPTNEPIQNSQLGPSNDIDVRSYGGYVVAPGNPGYTTEIPFEEMAMLPKAWLDLLTVGGSNKDGWGKFRWDDPRITETNYDTLKYLMNVFGLVDPVAKPRPKDLLDPDDQEYNSYYIGVKRPGTSSNISVTVGHNGEGHVHVFSSSITHPTDPGVTLPPGSNWDIPMLEIFMIEREDPQYGTEPVLAEEAYHGPLGTAVRLFEDTEAAPAGVMASLLVGFGNLVGDGTYVRPTRNNRQHTRLNAVIVGKSGSSRKSSSWEHAESLLRKVDPSFKTDSGFGSGHILVDTIAERSGTSKVNSDGSIDLTKHCARMMIFEDEFSSLLKTVNTEGNKLSEHLRSAFNGKALVVRSRGKTSEAPEGSHFLSVMGCITDSELLKTLTGKEKANGFGNRIMFVYAHSNNLVAFDDLDEEEEEQELEEQAEIIRDCLDHAQNRGRITFTDEARNLWIEVYRDLRNVDEQKDPDLLELTARGDVVTLRMALIYALADKADQIGVEHIRAASAMWQYCNATVEYIFSKKQKYEEAVQEERNQIAVDTLAGKVFDAIFQAGNDGMTKSYIMQKVVGTNRSKETGPVLQELLDRGKIVHHKMRTGNTGRPGSYYFATEFDPLNTNNKNNNEGAM